MRVLVTGGAGFIGSHCCEALTESGHEVVAFDCFTPFYDPALKHRNISEAIARSGGHLSLIKGDVLTPNDLARAFAAGPFDCVIHLAASVGVRPSTEQPAAYMRNNVEGTASLLAAMTAHACNRLVFASSSSVYGDTATAPFAEHEAADLPVSPYAASKRAAELLCHSWHALHGTDVFALRFFTVYGPRQRPEMAFHKFATAMARDEPITMYGDGSSSRDYTYVGDIASAVVTAAERARGFELINVGGDREISLSAVIELLGQALGTTPLIDRRARSAGDVRQTSADISRAQALLDYAPQKSLTAGLAEFAAWFAEHGVH
ncbi:MAG: NAD-dependent epimerase/dehydratase family protein [Myxococcales bacterium]|nr:NAD-dependent epimerase/dehydratase family protein [Myxococcales bacterium]